MPHLPSEPPTLPGYWQPLPRQPLFQPHEQVAPWLLGKLLARHTPQGWLAGRIVETEAYLGPHITNPPDPAAHSFRGVTDRNRVMFGPPGHAYVYFIYGMHFCANVTCEPAGMAGCVLVRALEPVAGLDLMARNRGLSSPDRPRIIASGPGKLCRALDLDRSRHNGADLLAPDSEIRLCDHGDTPGPISIGPRIGIRHAADLPLRFWLTGNPCVSRP